VLAILAGALLSDGCRRKPPQQTQTPEERAAAEQRLLSEINQVFVRAENALAEGRTNDAVSSVDAACSNRAFAAYRPQIFETSLRLLLRIGRVDDVRQRALAASSDPALATGACGLLYRFYHDSGDLPNAVAWASELAERPSLTPEMRRQALAWAIEDRIALREDDKALAVLNKAAQTLRPAETLSLVRLAIEALFGAGRLDGIEPVLNVAAGLTSSAAEVNRLRLATHLRVSSARGDWEGLTNEFPVAAGALLDGELDGLLRAITQAAGKAGKRAVIDQCAEIVILSPSAASNRTAVATAARVWAESAMEADKGAFPGRLATMLRAKIPADNIIELYLRFYYQFTEQPVPLKELMALGERLAPLAADEDTRNDVKIKVLDGCFLVQDYDRALTMLESRIPGPGRSEQWHQTAIVKVKAHRALQRNEPREAVKFFREFMGQMRDSKEAEVSDPVTGVMFPKEMVLGRNARRIGDILGGIPDAAEAAKAYAEARDLYAQALKETKDADARKVIETEIAALPKTATP
jgi:tetratricopeptide (TPR) repeat protein